MATSTLTRGRGSARRTGRRLGVMQENWSPFTRLWTGVGGGGLALWGLVRRDAIGAAVGLVGAGVLLRSLTNLPMKRLTGMGAGRRAIDIQKTIHIGASIEHVFEFFSNYANFPRFMSNVREVRDHLSGRSHWVVAGPMGVDVEWDADLTDYAPDRVIAWKSVEGSAVEHAGIIRFEEDGDDSTRVHIRLSYNPPAGALGHAVASIFGADPKRELDADLMRVKTTLETGRAAHDAAHPVGTAGA